MARAIRIFHLSAGDCGACAAEVWAAVENAPDLLWAATPHAADLLVLTGTLPPISHSAVLALYTTFVRERTPLVIVGRCAIDGYPFGQGGVAALPQIEAERKVDGSPPLAEAIVVALREAARPASAKAEATS